MRMTPHKGPADRQQQLEQRFGHRLAQHIPPPLRMGSMVKVLALYPRPFWRERGLLAGWADRPSELVGSAAGGESAG